MPWIKRPRYSHTPNKPMTSSIDKVSPLSSRCSSRDTFYGRIFWNSTWLCFHYRCWKSQARWQILSVGLSGMPSSHQRHLLYFTGSGSSRLWIGRVSSTTTRVTQVFLHRTPDTFPFLKKVIRGKIFSQILSPFVAVNWIFILTQH